MAEESVSGTDGSFLSLTVFLIITIVYYLLLKPPFTIDLVNGGNPDSVKDYQKKKMGALLKFLLFIVVGQYSVNSYLLITNCGGDVVKNMIAALFMTFIPWFLIFGALVASLVIFPGFKSAFSNVIGYFIVASKANLILTTLLKNSDLQAKIREEDPEKQKALESAAEAILKLCGNTGILINQISPDNFSEYWGLLKPLLKDEFQATDGDSYKGELLKLVVLRDNVGEALWYIYTAVLIVSIVQMNMTTRGCQTDAATMEANRQKYLDAQATFQADQDKLKNQVYTV